MTTQSETPRVDAVAVSAVAREVTALTAQLAEARKVLLWSRQKLELYRSEHSGQYIGGMEYTELIRYIDAAMKEPK